MKEVETHVQKTSYEEKKNRHHVYSSIADQNASSPRMPAPPRKPPDSDIYNQIKSPEMMPDSNVNTFVPPDQELRRPRNEETVIPGIPIRPDVQNYMDGFVHCIIFMLAFVFVLFVRMSI